MGDMGARSNARYCAWRDKGDNDKGIVYAV